MWWFHLSVFIKEAGTAMCCSFLAMWCTWPNRPWYSSSINTTIIHHESPLCSRLWSLMAPGRRTTKTKLQDICPQYLRYNGLRAGSQRRYGKSDEATTLFTILFIEADPVKARSPVNIIEHSSKVFDRRVVVYLFGRGRERAQVTTWDSLF